MLRWQCSLLAQTMIFIEIYGLNFLAKMQAQDIDVRICKVSEVIKEWQGEVLSLELNHAQTN